MNKIEFGKVARLWIAPDGTEFVVSDTHQDWIASHLEILDKYKVKNIDRNRHGLMRFAGWIRGKKGQWAASQKQFKYVEVQFNLDNKNANAWKQANGFLLGCPRLEVLIADPEGQLLTMKTLLKSKHLIDKSVYLRMKQFVEGRKN
ncbi:MAG: hypothetical protein WC614_07630 [bacterium]